MSVTIPGYERFREIGTGGFSRVFEAYEREFNRRVAIKILNIEGDTGFDRAAFEAECQAMGSVSEHPNIVTVFASGFTAEGAPYIAMERYHETLLDRVRTSSHLPVDQVVDLGVKMAGALHRAHEARLLHRDVKPQNIFFSKYGEPVLGDFGIAALTGRRDTSDRVGFTPSYAAPEVVEGLAPTVESDLYSLGATLYTALAGRRPFSRNRGESDDALYHRIRTEMPPDITAQHLPDPVRRIIFGLLVKHPTDRPRQAIDLGGLLRDAQVRLGLPVTPLVLPNELADDLDTTITRTRSAGNLAPAGDDLTSSTTVVGARAAGVDGVAGRAGGGSGVGVAERRGTAPEATGNRALLAVGGLVATVVVAATGIWVAAGGGDDDPESEAVLDSSTSTTLDLKDESPLAAPDQPVVSAGTDAIEVSWSEVDRATGYRVEILGTGRRVEVVDDPSLTLPADEVELPICVQVRAVGEAGQLSPFSPQACGSGS